MQDRFGRQLRHASLVMMSHLVKSLAPLGLTPVESAILKLIIDNPGCQQRDICKALDMKSANTTPVIAKLARREFIRKVMDGGKSKLLIATDQGRAISAEAERAIEEHERDFARLMTPQQRGTVVAVLQVIGEIGKA